MTNNDNLKIKGSGWHFILSTLLSEAIHSSVNHVDEFFENEFVFKIK